MTHPSPASSLPLSLLEHSLALHSSAPLPPLEYSISDPKPVCLHNLTGVGIYFKISCTVPPPLFPSPSSHTALLYIPRLPLALLQYSIQLLFVHHAGWFAIYSFWGIRFATVYLQHCIVTTESILCLCFVEFIGFVALFFLVHFGASRFATNSTEVNPFTLLRSKISILSPGSTGPTQ